MGFNILGKLTGVEAKVEWSKAKKIEAVEPYMYGQHFIYVDSDFNVAIFMPKADKTIHVFCGDIFRADRWLKFNSDGSKEIDKTLDKKSHEWKINPKNIYYRGRMLPPDQPVYKGIVQKYDSFNETINDDWIVNKKDDLLKQMGKTQNLVY